MSKLFVGKTTLETILFVVLSVLGLIAPGAGWITVDGVTEALLNVGAFVVLIIGLTTLTKGWIGYDGESPNRKKWIPKSIAFGWSTLLSFAGYFASFGLFAVFSAAYEVLIASILLTGVARDFYSLDLAVQIIKFLTSEDLSENSPTEDTPTEN